MLKYGFIAIAGVAFGLFASNIQAAGKIQCPNDYHQLKEFCDYRVPQELDIASRSVRYWEDVNRQRQQTLVPLKCKDKGLDQDQCISHYKGQGFIHDGQGNYLELGPLYKVKEGIATLISLESLYNYLSGDGDKFHHYRDKGVRIVNYLKLQEQRNLDEWHDADYRCCQVKLPNLERKRREGGYSGSGLGERYDSSMNPNIQPYRPPNCNPQKTMKEFSGNVDQQWLRDCNKWRDWYWKQR